MSLSCEKRAVFEKYILSFNPSQLQKMVSFILKLGSLGSTFKPKERNLYVIYDCNGVADSVAAGVRDRHDHGRLHSYPPRGRDCDGFAPGHFR